MTEAKIKVAGKVQGVFYRDFVQEQAEELDVVGWAKNEPDGSVRVLAQGYEARVKEFVKRLEEGPELADVSFVSVLWGSVDETLPEFSIVT